MTSRQEEFLAKLADLMEEYGVSIDYTIDDDGLHIMSEGQEVFVGWLDSHADLRERIGR